MSGWLLMGLPGAIYAGGLIEAWLAIGLTLGAYLNWKLVAGRLRAQTEYFGDALTLPEYFHNRFGDKTRIIKILSALIFLLFFAVYCASGVVAGARVFENLFGVPYADAILSQFAGAFRGRTVHFPGPALFDYASTREAMLGERSVQGVLAIQERVDLAVFGVGSLRSPVPSQVYAGGYLNEEDRRALDAEGVVADVCTVFLRADGSYRDISLNARASGPTPAQLSRIKTRVMVASSAAKAPAILAALRARVATDVVLDVAAAQAVLALAGRNRMGIGLGSHKPVES